MSGAIFLLPLYAFMEWRGIIYILQGFEPTSTIFNVILSLTYLLTYSME
jgi:hypothetical protein